MVTAGARVALFKGCQPSFIEMVADVVRRRSAAAGSLDGWGWREMKAVLVARFNVFARILSKVEETVFWPEGLFSRLCIVFGLVFAWWSWTVGFSLGF